MVIAVVPIVGAVDDRNTNSNKGSSSDGLEIGVSSDDVKSAEAVLQNNKPFGENTTKVLGTNNTTNEPQIMKLGASGDKVKEIQQWLTDYGYYSGNIDGDFGTDTEKAVKAFQEESGLIVDGIVGNDTEKAMDTWDKNLAQVQAAAGEDTSASSSSSSSSKKAYASTVRSYSNSYSSSWSNGKGTGDCWDNSAALYSSLTSSGQRARIVQYANSYVSNHLSVETWNGNKWVNYDYKGNGYAQRYYATSHSSSAKVIASS